MTHAGTMEPLPSGTPPSSTIIRYLPPVWTALSIYEYATIMGISPVAFMSGSAPALFSSRLCQDTWYQYPWQDQSSTSRDELAREILRAERDIASILGYYPGPRWEAEEQHNYPHYHRRNYVTASGRAINGLAKSLKMRFGKFIASGKRKITLVETPAVVLTDDDGDSFEETANVTYTITDAALVNSHKVYYADKLGDPRYEIRPAREIIVVGTTVTVKFDAWQLFKPDLLSAWPGDGMTAIDATLAASYVSEVDVYLEEADRSLEATMYWRSEQDSCSCGSSVCPVCSNYTQIACVQQAGTTIQNMLSIMPASYSDGAFTYTYFDKGREPDRVNISYLAGDYELDINGNRVVPADLAKAIAYMVTARLPKPICSQCQNISDFEKWLREDLAFAQVGGSGDVRFVSPEVLRAKFGTRRGEVEAWNIVQARVREGNKSISVAVF